MSKTNQPTHRIHRMAIIAATATAITLLGACSPNKTAGFTHSNNNMVVLDEIQLQSGMAGYQIANTQTDIQTGPVLVAGDWLAIQCASAGGYFEGFDWAPVYANIDATDFE